VYVSQNLKFLRPIYHDEEIEAVIQIKGQDIKNKSKLIVTTQLFKFNNNLKELATDGEAIVKIPENKFNII
jgi:hypothetical protein